MPTAEQVMQGIYTPAEAHLIHCLQWALDYIEAEAPIRKGTMNALPFYGCRMAIAEHLARSRCDGQENTSGRPQHSAAKF